MNPRTAPVCNCSIAVQYSPIKVKGADPLLGLENTMFKEDAINVLNTQPKFADPVKRRKFTDHIDHIDRRVRS